MENTQDLTPLMYPSGDLPKPEINKTHPRLYGHNLCPFVERARLALVATGF